MKRYISRKSEFKDIYPEKCCEEIRECDKHEIISKISDIIGPCPGNFCVAETIFDQIKYDIAKYIINHEFCDIEVEDSLLKWLEEKSSPESIEKLTRFIDFYLK